MVLHLPSHPSQDLILAFCTVVLLHAATPHALTPEDLTRVSQCTAPPQGMHLPELRTQGGEFSLIGVPTPTGPVNGFAAGGGLSASSLVTRAVRKDDKVTLWLSNVHDASEWDAYEVVLVSGILATCGASTYSPVRYSQYYEDPNETEIIEGDKRHQTEDVEVPAVKWRDGEAVIVAENAFTIPVPPRTVTKVMFDVAPGSDAVASYAEATFACESDTSILQDGDLGLPSDSALRLNREEQGDAAFGLLKFSTAGLTGVVTKATLYLHIGDSAIEELLVEAVASSSWQADSVRWSTQPARAELALSAASLAAANTWQAFDVTFALDDTAEATRAFLLSVTQKPSAGDYSEVHSMESAFAPYLVVESLAADPIPAGVCATPPSSPPPPLNMAAIYVADACPSSGSAPEAQYVEDSQILAFACCSEDGMTCRAKTSSTSSCYERDTWAGANAMCAAEGRRLCTAAELATDVCCDKGCDMNHELTWTSQTRADMMMPPSIPSPPTPVAPPPAVFCQMVTEGMYATCVDYTSQTNYNSQDEVEAAAREGAYAGYAYTSDQGKGQLFTSDQCVEINTGNLQNNWLVFTAAACTSPPPLPPAPPPLVYCQLDTGTPYARCLDFSSQRSYGSQEEVLEAARSGGFAGYAYTSDQGKGQLFTEAECMDVDAGNLGNNWLIFRRDACPSVSASPTASPTSAPPLPAPPPFPPSPPSPPVPPTEYCLEVFPGNAKCVDYTTQKRYASLADLEFAAREGGFTGYAYSSNIGKGQLFTSEQCREVNAQNVKNDWNIFSARACLPPLPFEYCQVDTGTDNAKCNDYSSQSDYATQAEIEEIARAGGYTGYAFSSEQGSGQLFRSGQCTDINAGNNFWYDWHLFRHCDEMALAQMGNELSSSIGSGSSPTPELNTPPPGAAAVVSLSTLSAAVDFNAFNISEGDYDDGYEANFMYAYAQEVASAAGVVHSDVEILRIAPGLVVDARVHYMDTREARQFLQVLQADGTETFSSEFTDKYGTVELRDSSMLYQNGPPPSGWSCCQEHTQQNFSVGDGNIVSTQLLVCG
ncbi:hypothetical protein CYMTET_31285 [Cymbomonas tetramitiformis]|uniref:Carbohydrate-binding module family 96 domain-containing protein n=1 Tax=Cymbomonas tetramitiformis TaxID=36881 RepID=A0AAE0FHB3_9CHLO|nr:hypothetical protein CYMTET_31285 [Cymbomonas tetramitiformis]